MDNTELHYLSYDPEEIWEQMMQKYIAAGGDILYPGDEKEMLLRGVQADIVQVFAGIDHALRMQTLRYAAGEYLDILGEARGCARIEAAAATASVTITTRATGTTETLEAGTTMTADGVVFYELTEDFVLTGYQQSASAGIRAVRAGSAGNGLLSGVQMQLAMTNPGVLSIVTSSAASGGNEREDDETYRARIRAFGQAGVTTGPSSRYEAAAKGASGEVVDAKALNLGAGQVGVYVILESSTGAAAILQRIEEALNARDTRPLTDSVSVAQATAVTYTLNVEYRRPSSVPGADIAAAVREYQSWQDDTIGLAFDPYRLISLLYQAGATNVSFGSGSNFDGGSVSYTEIEPSERCSGTITLTETD